MSASLVGSEMCIRDRGTPYAEVGLTRVGELMRRDTPEDIREGRRLLMRGLINPDNKAQAERAA
eukprot:9006465-Alexandrium_andersonii.AAC.1